MPLISAPLHPMLSAPFMPSLPTLRAQLPPKASFHPLSPAACGLGLNYSPRFRRPALNDTRACVGLPHQTVFLEGEEPCISSPTPFTAPRIQLVLNKGAASSTECPQHFGIAWIWMPIRPLSRPCCDPGYVVSPLCASVCSCVNGGQYEGMFLRVVARRKQGHREQPAQSLDKCSLSLSAHGVSPLIWPSPVTTGAAARPTRTEHITRGPGEAPRFEHQQNLSSTK